VTRRLFGAGQPYDRSPPAEPSDLALADNLAEGQRCVGVANRLRQQLQDEHPAVPWRTIIGMGNIVAHEYAIRADPDTMWNILEIEFRKLDVFHPA